MRFRVTVRGGGAELRGYVDGEANLRMLSSRLAGRNRDDITFMVVASPADDDYDPFDRWDESDGAKAWLDRANEELRPMIQGSAHTMALISGEEPDAKQAVELGFMILLDKPIIAAVVPGVKVPDHLVRCADEIVEVDMEKPHEAAEALTEAIKRIEAQA